MGCILVIACVYSNLLRLPLPNNLVPLRPRSLATIANYFITEFLLPDRLFLKTPCDSGLPPVPLNDCCRPPSQVAEPEILHQRVLVSFACERDPHVNPLCLHGVPDNLQLLPQELYLEGRSSKFHALLAGMNKLIVLLLTTSHHGRWTKTVGMFCHWSSGTMTPAGA